MSSSCLTTLSRWRRLHLPNPPRPRTSLACWNKCPGSNPFAASARPACVCTKVGPRGRAAACVGGWGWGEGGGVSRAEPRASAAAPLLPARGRRAHQPLALPPHAPCAEIVELSRYLRPTAEETAERQGAVGRVLSAVKMLWPGAEMQTFGSYAMGAFSAGGCRGRVSARLRPCLPAGKGEGRCTVRGACDARLLDPGPCCFIRTRRRATAGLHTPTSDIDAVVMGSEAGAGSSPLYALSTVLQRHRIATNIQVHVVGRPACCSRRTR